MTKLIKNQKNVFLGKLIFGLMYFFLLSTNLYSIEPLIIKEDIGEYPLGMHLELLEDKEGILSINDLKNQDGKQNWIKSKSNIPNLAYTKSVYWIHFNIENQMEDKEFILEISYPLLDKLELYYSENNSSEFLVKKGGDFSPFNTRDIRYHNFLFRLPIKLNETKRIFLRVETASSMQIPLKLYTPVSLIQKVNLEMVALGIYYGIMMAMILYNSFLFISVRDKSYLYYVLYITSFAILQATINGVIFEYFGNFFPFINETAAYQMIICCIFIVLFVRSFLQTKENAPKLNRVLKGLFIYLCIVPFFFLKLNYSQGAKIASITVILCLLLVIIIGFIVLRRGFKPARYFLLAWMFFLVGSILLALRQVGILPSFFLTENGAQIGSTIEVMLLSLGLGDRINVMRKEKEIAQAETLETQRILNQDLGKMVKQRTLELENAHQKILVLEKETTEKQLAGGFAHEMRNALVGPKLIIQNALGEDGDVPFQSVSIENSRKLKEIYFLIKDDISENKLKQALNLMSSIYQNEEQMDKNLKMIYRSIAKGLSITQTIMDYAAMGNEVTNRSSIDLILFLKNIIREQEEEFNKLDIKIQLNTSESSFLFLGHESHFDSLFKNIILNAKDALLEKKALGSVDLKIDIDVRLLDSNFILQIKDNGIGILSENLNKIYDAFFSTKPGTGTGLGLGVVKKIINMYNGKINVKSEFQKGTVFEITLPVL